MNRCTEQTYKRMRYECVTAAPESIRIVQKMRGVLRLTISATSLLSVLPLASVTRSATAKPLERAPVVVEPTKVVTIKPPYGYSNSKITVRLSKSEVDIVRRLQAQSFDSPYPSNITPIPIIWKLESGIEKSQTFQLARKGLFATEELLGRPGEIDPYPIVIIVGRTQNFFRKEVAALGCAPDLRKTAGQYLMGATLCNRRVIVINLTGYYFLRYYGQRITTAMELKPEPTVSAVLYLLVLRNIGSLAHEWTHVVRALPSQGRVSSTEPAWLNEGMAEILSGMASVRASAGKMNYLQFHIIRLRKFSNWPNSCRLSLTAYRKASTTLGGCEYLRGAAAVELLIANYGGVRKLMALYDDAHDTYDFFSSFQRIYGMSIRTFELKADKYARYISAAANY